MSALFKGNISFRQFAAILFFQLIFIRQKNIHAQALRQQRRPCSAFASSQYDCSFFHLSFKVVNVNTANKIPMIQKRVTIFAFDNDDEGAPSKKIFVLPRISFWYI